MTPTLLKHLHLFALALSFSLFFLRGMLMISSAKAAKARFFNIAPHILNTILIASGITLAVTLHLSPGEQPWLIAKLAALVVYIATGILAFKHKNKLVRICLWCVSIFIFGFMISVAHSKNPIGFFAYLL
jgi:uncharacterized membrane protein SirB2